jgi:hypothetical protein
MKSEIFTNNLKDQFASFFKEVKSELFIMAPYVSPAGVQFIKKHLVSKVKITAVFPLDSNDLISGFTNSKAIDELLEMGCKVSFLENLHAKCFIADRNKILIGSANVTNSGMGDSKNANIEFMQSSIISKAFAKEIEQTGQQVVLAKQEWDKVKKLISQAQKETVTAKKGKAQKDLENLIKSKRKVKSKPLDFISHCEGYEGYYKCDNRSNIYTNGSLSFKSKISKRYESRLDSNGSLYKYAIKEKLLKKLKGENLDAILFQEKDDAGNAQKDFFLLPYKLINKVLDHQHKHSNLIIAQEGKDWFLIPSNQKFAATVKKIKVNEYLNLLPHNLLSDLH